MMGSNPSRNDKALEAGGMASKLEIALALVAARKGVALSQAELARRSGWKSQFVCRLESLNGRLPNLVSLVRYAQTCGLDVGLFLFDTRWGFHMGCTSDDVAGVLGSAFI